MQARDSGALCAWPASGYSPCHAGARRRPPISPASASPRSRGWPRSGGCRRSRSWNPTHCGDSADADRARRHLVSRRQPDRPAGDGAALLDHPAPRAGRRLRAGHAGREARHRGRGCAVRRGRAEERGRGPGPHRSPSGSTPATSSSPGPTTRCASKRARTGRIPISAVRPGLEALVARPVYYELAEIALAEGAEPPGVWSGGAFFALEPGA